MEWQIVRQHYADVYASIENNTFQSVVIGRMDNESIERILWMDFWDAAIQRNAFTDFHDMSLRTPAHCVIDVWNLCVQMHGIKAVVGLAPRFKREFVGTGPLLPQIQCSDDGTRCEACAEMRYAVFQKLRQVPLDNERDFLEDDYACVRAAMRRSRHQNLMLMRHPIFMLSYKTDIIYPNIYLKTKRYWNMVLFSICARALWRRFIERQYHPDSKYVQKIKAKFILNAIANGTGAGANTNKNTNTNAI
jgi:hypothetical protein